MLKCYFSKMPPIRGKTSEVWNHFTVEEYQKAKCDHCNVLISTAGGSLNNLKRHMKAKHFTVPLNRNESVINNGQYQSIIVCFIKYLNKYSL